MIIYNKNIKKYVYFVHIPRTAGRFVSNIFKQDNNYLTYLSEFGRFYSGKEIPHLTYPKYLDLDKIFIDYNVSGFKMNNIPHFTVVREPFNKFKSEMKSVLKNKNDLNFILKCNKDSLKNFLDLCIKNNQNNWHISQSSFVMEKTKIWKFEDGFDINFINWVKKNFNFDIKTKNAQYLKSPLIDQTELDLNTLQKIKPLVYEIYKDDYLRFGYKYPI